jgi:WD repeat-containing protein 26
MLPEHRLAVLLEQVKESQISSCLFHTSAQSPSLYADHVCDRSQFPSEVMVELEKHSNEVWQIAFSHDGSRLASCGQDSFVLIWEVPSFELLHTLDAHDDKGVGNVAWSPDDSMIVTCGRDHYAKIWDAEVGYNSCLLF